MTNAISTTKTSTRHRRRRSHSESVDDPLLRVVDGGLAGGIFLLPLIMGGRQALGELVLSLLALGITLAWSMRQFKSGNFTWRKSALEWVLLAGVLLLAIQFVPMPRTVLAWLSPHLGQVLPLWSSPSPAATTLGTWPYVSFAPGETRAGLMTLISYCLVFLVTVQRIEQASDIERLLRWCAFSAVFMAAFGIVQFLTSNGKFFWFYQHPYSTTDDTAKGSFVNRNHFADFLALGTGPLIWWIQYSLRRRQRQIDSKSTSSDSQLREILSSAAVVALGVVVFGCMMSLSRGGMMAMVIAAAVASLVCYRASALSFRFAASLGAVVLLVAVFLSVFGYDRVSRRLSDLQSGSFEQLDHGEARSTIWTAVMKAAPDFLACGAGVGSLRDVYPRYLDAPTGRDYYTHAENGPLQVALETGVPGIAILVVVIGFCAFWCLDGLRRSDDKHTTVCLGAVLAALTASLAHSMVDFNWYCPACMTIVAILAACGCRLWQLTSESEGSPSRVTRFSRPVAIIMTVVLVGMGGWILTQRLGSVVAERHWYQVRMLDLTTDMQRQIDQDELPALAGQDDGQPGLTTNQSEEDQLAAMDAKDLAELQELVRWQPDHAQAHLRLAAIYLRQFHRLQQQCPNVMPLGQIREAAFAARNAAKNPLNSRKALEEWMRRAFGDHCQYLDLALSETHQALALEPLVAEGYLYLGELCFLEGGGPETKRAYLEQALKLQPFDATVLFSVGTDAWLAGKLEEGLNYLRASFHAGDDHQEQIIEWLAGRSPPEARQAEIQFLLENFQPDYEGLRLLDQRYSQIAQPEELVTLHRHFAQVAETEATRSDPTSGRTGAIWLTAHMLYDQLGDYQRATYCAQNAMRVAPNNYALRHQLGVYYCKLQQFDEAQRHFKWCLAQRPHDAGLQSRLNDLERLRLAQETPGLLPIVAPGFAAPPAYAIPPGYTLPARTATPQGIPVQQGASLPQGFGSVPSPTGVQPTMSPGAAIPAPTAVLPGSAQPGGSLPPSFSTIPRVTGGPLLTGTPPATTPAAAAIRPGAAVSAGSGSGMTSPVPQGAATPGTPSLSLGYLLPPRSIVPSGSTMTPGSMMTPGAPAAPGTTVSPGYMVSPGPAMPSGAMR